MKTADMLLNNPIKSIENQDDDEDFESVKDFLTNYKNQELKEREEMAQDK